MELQEILKRLYQNPKVLINVTLKIGSNKMSIVIVGSPSISRVGEFFIDIEKPIPKETLLKLEPYL